MARGGRRKGSPGKSYSNRSDLNVDRAVQPGSSAAPPPAVEQPDPTIQAAEQHISPDSFPNLTDPTNMPDIPGTSGVTGGPGADFDLMPVAQQWNQAFAEALSVYPGDPDLLRIARYIRVRSGR